VVVHYESRRLADLEAAGIHVDWQVASGSVRVGNVVLPRVDTVVAVQPEAAREREAGGLRGTLRVLEGETGRIASGVEVPVTRLHRTPYALHETTSFVSADSGFEVTPRVQGDGRVRLALAPFDARLGPGLGAGPSVARSSAETVVNLAPGETVAVGGLTRESIASDRDLFTGAARESAREESVLLVRVEVD
jgi:hypothetical protein